MFDELVVLNRLTGNEFQVNAESRGWVNWQTCVRRVLIGHRDTLDEVKLIPGDEIFHGDDAYRFCMEVICGLHSPMTGETEVFGQFKQLVDQYEACPYYQVDMKRWLLDMIADAKSVRQHHLTGLGSQSYGSVLRRKVKELKLKEVNIVGSGLLVKDILPWLTKLGIAVRVHCRTLSKGKALQKEFPNILVEPLINNNRPRMTGVLVIAAPVRSPDISHWLNTEDEDLSLVMDLRGDSHTDQIMTRCVVEDLTCIFNEVEETKDKLESKIEQAKEMIFQLAQEKQNRMQVRPHGWFDIV